MALFAGVEYAIVPSDIKDPTLRKINADSRRVARSKGNRLKLSKITPNDFRVHLEDRGFAKFPEAVLRDNSKLRGLFLSRNTLKVIPSGIIKLKMLQKLVLSGNCLSEVPKEVGKWRRHAGSPRRSSPRSSASTGAARAPAVGEGETLGIREAPRHAHRAKKAT